MKKSSNVLFVDQDKSEIVIKEDEKITIVIVISSRSCKHIECRVRLVGQGAHAEIIGLVSGVKDDALSLQTFQIHEAPETTSSLLVKSVLDGDCRFIYDGTIRVEKNAQKTNAYQRNENLILSPMAYAKSNPTLEILANDVRCTHAATVGTLPQDQLWYLATRGIGRKEAERLMVRGFLESAILKIPDTIMQEKVRRILWTTL